MIDVSEAWIENQKEQYTSKAYLNITLKIGDPDADSKINYIFGHPKAPESNDYSVYKSLPGSNKRYATLEQNLTVLDGSSSYLPEYDSPSELATGFVSGVQSDPDGWFARFSPNIRITFDSVLTVPIKGISVKWASAYGEYAVDFHVSVSNGGEDVFVKRVMNNNQMTCILDADIAAYDSVNIAVFRWALPYHKARIDSIFSGIMLEYQNEDIFSFQSTESASPYTEFIPERKVSFALDNTDGRFTVDAPSQYGQYLLQEQRVDISYGFDINDNVEWIPKGSYYLSGWEIPHGGLTADFEATDVMYKLRDRFEFGYYVADGLPVGFLIEFIMQRSGIKFEYDPELENKLIKAPFPATSKAECLQLLANAMLCSIRVGRDGVVRIMKPVKTPVDYTVNEFISYQYPKSELIQPIKAVNVAVHSYAIDKSERKEIYKTAFNFTGEKVVRVDFGRTVAEPLAEVTGGELVTTEYFASACYLTINCQGDVSIKVTAFEITDDKSSITLESGSADGQVLTFDNPLIATAAHAQAYAEEMLDYYKRRTKLEGQIRFDPRVDVLDVVHNDDYAGKRDVLMTDADVAFTGAFHGNIKGRVVSL